MEGGKTAKRRKRKRAIWREEKQAKRLKRKRAIWREKKTAKRRKRKGEKRGDLVYRFS